MTFEEFQATGLFVTDLRKEIDGDYFDQEMPGFVYAGGLYIESGAGGYCLTIANTSKQSTSLAELERELYDYGKREALI